jgi:uncharacterized repeat protein (TIGR03803 family)
MLDPIGRMQMRISRIWIIAAAVLALLSSAAIADAQTARYKMLYAFTGGSDGNAPEFAPIFDAEGNIYGVTSRGGDGCCGTVFKLSGDGNLTTLHAFAGGKDGAYASGSLLLDDSGNLYGTTSEGGGRGLSGNCGTIFRIAADGVEKKLHVFSGDNGDGDGCGPFGGLVRDQDGSLYGTTAGGGKYGWGSIFKIDANDSLTILYSFRGGPEGVAPKDRIFRDAAGNIYGTTLLGGNSECHSEGCGTVFRLANDGTHKTLRQFRTKSDGWTAQNGNVIEDSEGAVFGATALGGRADCNNTPYGCGVIFKIDQQSKYSHVYRFKALPSHDGNQPQGGLILDAAGNLYGTAFKGGDYTSCGGGCGAIFRIAPDGTETVVYRFRDDGLGRNPFGIGFDSAGNLIGVTTYGGASNAGVVFRLKSG